MTLSENSSLLLALVIIFSLHVAVVSLMPSYGSRLSY